MANHYEKNEFEALKCRFKDQTELLYRITLLDLRIFTGYLTLQIALGAWIATHQTISSSLTVCAGLLLIDCSLAVIAIAFLYYNSERRLEVVETVKNCNEALGFEELGVYLHNRPLNAHGVPTMGRIVLRGRHRWLCRSRSYSIWKSQIIPLDVDSTRRG